MAAERQRGRFKFQSNLDEATGSKFNKQMEDQQLPCQPLNDAIFSIFKQVTAPWTKKWTPKTEVKEDSSVTDEFEEVDELPKPINGGSKPVKENKSVQKIQGSSVLTSITNAVMDEESATESVESSGSIPNILNTATVTEILEDQVQEAYEEEEQEEVQEQGQGQEQVQVQVQVQVQEKPYTIENNYFKVMNGREVIAKMPYSPGLENWITTVKLPTGKTLADFVKHSSTFWGIE
jgi:hypothetical protein